jgi:hypothetical protein
MTTENLYSFQEHKNLNTKAENEEDNTEKGVTESGGNCLECIGAVDSRMILQPLSINSSAHAKVSLKIHQRFKKENKIINQDNDFNMMNPDKIIAQVCKQEEEEIRLFRKQQLKAMEYRQSSGFGGVDPRGASSTSRGATAAGKSRPSMSSSYLDDNDLYEGEIGGAYARRAAVPAKKRKAPSKKRDGDEENDEDGEDLGSKDSEDEEDEEDDDQENDSIVVDDDEEEEEDGDDDEEGVEDDDDDDDDNESNEDGEEEGEATRSKKDKKKKKLGKKEKGDSRSDKKKKKKKNSKDKKKDKKKKEKEEGRKLAKTKRNADLEAANDSVAAVDKGDAEDEEEENLNLRFNKRLKRTVIESDDEEDV